MWFRFSGEMCQVNGYGDTPKAAYDDFISAICQAKFNLRLPIKIRPHATVVKSDRRQK